MATIRLLKKHGLGKAGNIVEVTNEQANYLVRMKVAESIEKEKSETDQSEKEKKEFTPEQEKAVHTGLPTVKKRGRPKKEL